MPFSKTKKRGLIDSELIDKLRTNIPLKKLESRRMKHFVIPRDRFLNEYETLCLYSQQGTDWASGGIDIGDSMQKWPGGRPTYAPETTEIKTSDWWRFRDPQKKWFYPYIKQKAEQGKSIQNFMHVYSTDGHIRLMNKSWRKNVLETYYGAFLFNEYGLFNAHSIVVHDCLSDVIRVFVSNLSFNKTDSAQTIQQQRIFLSKLDTDFDPSLDTSKDIWLNSPIFKTSREIVESLWGEVYDHMEILWVIYGIYGPLYGNFLRREFFLKGAMSFGDTMTPHFIGQLMDYEHYAREGIGDLFYFSLGNDQEFGDYNLNYLRAWTEKWLPKVIDSLGEFMEIFAKLSKADPCFSDFCLKENIEESLQRVLDDWVEDYAAPINYNVNKEEIILNILGKIQ